MSSFTKLKDLLNGGHGKNRREAINGIDEDLQKFARDISFMRVILSSSMANPDHSQELFDLQVSNTLKLMQTSMTELKQLKSSEDGTFYLSELQDGYTTMMLLANIEAVNKIQRLMWTEITKMIDALKSQTITKQELGARLEAIQKEFETKVPDPQSMKNIAWLKNRLRKASKTGGDFA